MAALAPNPVAGPVSFCDATLSHFDSGRPRRHVVADSVPRWTIELGNKFARLKALEAGWAGPDSFPVCQRTIFKAHRALSIALSGLDSPILPAVLPVADGGLQMEWHRTDYDFEIYFGPDDSVTAISEDLTSGAETEKDGNAAIDLLLSSVSRLAQSRSHARPVYAAQPNAVFEFAA